MRITIVSGFFLPIPPLAGGATEKSWYRLARIFAGRGHQVTVISRRWPGYAHEETVAGVRHLRLRGHDHRRRLWLNLLLDFLWSWRVFLALPPGDIVVVHAVTLPVWLGRLRPSAGRVVLMGGRMPKGQYRHYRTVSRILAASTVVQARIALENPTLASVARITGYPIDCTRLQRQGRRQGGVPIVIGYVGRLHEEKGLRLLTAAIRHLAATSRDLPPWRLLLCGPSSVAQGGSGDDFLADIRRNLANVLPASTFKILAPQFDEAALAAVYQCLDVFCYPSLAEQGETFGVAVAEAMAGGAVPVVSRLACFTDFIRDGENGAIFDHRAQDGATRLAGILSHLLTDAAWRGRLAAAAVESVHRYDYSTYAGALLDDFTQLTSPPNPATSMP